MRQQPIRAERKSSRKGAGRNAAAVLARLGAAALPLVLAGPALASTSGGTTMPWDSMITNIENDITGPVATGIGVIACVLFGVGMAMGHEGSALKRGLQILFGLAIAFASTSAILSVFGGGSGAVI